ncbi:MAG TPA: hypothetical protein VF475_04750 [Sphingobium sp.]
MRRPLLLVGICALTLPFAVLTAMGSSTAATGPEAPVDAAMTLEGRLLLETSDRDGTARRTLREPSEVRSGDRLIFLIRYHNGGGALSGYDFVSPVPRGVHILPDRSDSVRVSVDDGQNWSRPDSPLQAPTRVRLRLTHTIAPGETGTVAYRGILL